MNRPLSRRAFVATAALLPAALRAADKSPASRWTIGCFNRPWVTWGYDAALDAIKAAGYRATGLLSFTKGEAFVSPAATPDYLAALKRRIAARGLEANMATLRVKHGVPLAESIADLRQQLANVHTLGLPTALTFGVDRPEHYADYYKVMADAAAFAQERGIQLALKPHGGGSSASAEIRAALKAIGHANFKVWYDAGNILHYTGKDPVAELAPIAEHVTGLCAKDCVGPKGAVMIPFGTGRVDFAGLFKKLKSAGFSGPVMVEGCQVADTPQATMENARANRLFLERVLASV